MRLIHYEIVQARKYYGKHTVGSVLLRNGHPEYHSSTVEVRNFLKSLKLKG